MTENKKYELTNETKKCGVYTLHRIRALKDFGDVKAGELGGWVESEHNLSQEGDCWIYDDARVFDGARVFGGATVRNVAIVGDVAKVYGRATIRDNAIVCSYATVGGYATIGGYARVCGYAEVYDYATVYRNTDYAVVQGFGREQRVTTFYRLKDGDIGVACGCFRGTIKQFRDKVKETHGDSKYAREYLQVADLMELHFGEETADEEKR